MDSRRQKVTAAFSLVELLVVITLIAMVAAMLLPALSKAKSQSTAAACLGNQRQLAAAFHMYAEDNDEYLVAMADYDSGRILYPAGGFWGGPDPGLSQWTSHEAAMDAIVTGLLLTNAYYAYCPEAALYHCPGDPRDQANPSPGASHGWAYDSYARTQNLGGDPANDFWGCGGTYRKLTSIPAPSLTFSMMESADWRGYNVGTWVVDWTGDTFVWVDPPAFWHLNVSSTAFADGHGELHKWIDPAIIADSTMAARGLNASQWTGPTTGPDFYYVFNHYLFPGHP